MKGMTEFQLRFLVGVVIAILIGFGIFYMYIHNAQDREVETTGYKFKEEIAAVCEDGNEREMDFQLPQPWTSSLKDKVEDVLNGAKKKLGIGGPELKIPLQAFSDPYYKIYWEQFPPEPPYYLGQDIPGTMASLFIPWSEDLPWSSNFFATLTLDSVFLGIDVFGIKIGKETIGDALKYKIFGPLQDSAIFNKLQGAWNALETGADATIEGTSAVIRAGKLLIREGKFVAKVTAAYTVFCLITQDKTLGECLKEGVVFGVGADVAKIILQKFAIPKLKSYLTTKIQSVKRAFSIKIDDFKNALSDYTDEVMGSNEVKAIWKRDGWVYDEVSKVWVAKREFGETAIENIINPLEQFANEAGNPDTLEDITFIYNPDGSLKEAIYNPKGFIENLKEKILSPFKNKIAKLEETIMSDNVWDSEAVKDISRRSKDFFEKNPEMAKEFLDIKGINVESVDEAVRILSTKFGDVIRRSDEDLVSLVVEKNSMIDNLFVESGVATEGYLSDIINLKDKNEINWLWGFINGKTLRLKEDVEIFSRGTFGYMLLRFQDLYTPLGATWWDKYFSYYGYETKRETPQGYCQTQCGYNMICVQLGACVRQYDLPESCVARGITSIKLRRDSLVAKDPRLYLVSPCESKLKIKLEGETIFIEPYMSENPDNKNYCYATAGLVNWYIGVEAGEYLARCLSSALCSLTVAVGTGGASEAVTGGSNIMSTIEACLGFGPKFSSVCSVISNFVGLLIDLYRETQLVWPTVYMSRPDLIDFKITSTSAGS